MTQHNNDIERVIDYWFGPVQKLELSSVKSSMDLWFGGTPEIDEDIRTRFLALVRSAAVGDLDSWAETARGALALVILLDQFTLNIFRDQPRSFTMNHLALPYALKAITLGYDQAVEPIHAAFFYLPLEHAEDIHMQNEAVDKYKDLVKRAPEGSRAMFESFLDYAERHHRVIAQFGRYPDRNPILGRRHTPAEAAYMAAGGPDF